jgi:hypothetical protein
MCFHIHISEFNKMSFFRAYVLWNMINLYIVFRGYFDFIYHYNRFSCYMRSRTKMACITEMNIILSWYCQTSWFNGSALDLCLGSDQCVSWWGHQRPWELSWFSSVPLSKCRHTTSGRPCLLPSSFSIHYLSVFILFNTA